MTTFLPIEKARIHYNPSMDTYDVNLISMTHMGGTDHVCPISAPCITTVSPGYVAPGPAFSLSRQAGQALLDALLEAGFKPSKSIKTETDGSTIDLVLRMHSEHVADLRRAAFGREKTPDEPATEAGGWGAST